MAVQDLPPEIWLEILKYIPRSTHHKLVGVNRVLFELALDFLYEEIRFIDVDREMLKSFEQIQTFPTIARRVRRLLIRPAFLPGLNEPLPQGSNNKALKLAATALKRCHDIQEIAIILHDHKFTPSFSKFLNSLWRSASFALKLRRLSINTTPAKISRLLSPLVANKKRFTDVEEVSFDISQSRVGSTWRDLSSLTRIATAFFFAFKKTLNTINLTSNSLSINFVDAVVSHSLTFHKLQKFKLSVIFESGHESGPRLDLEKWSKFIARHASTLQDIWIKHNMGQNYYDFSDRTYVAWINPSKSLIGSSAFAGLIFPNLKSLQIDLRERERDSRYFVADSNRTRVLPNPISFAPNLTSLTLTGISLSLRRISDIVDDLSPCGTLIKLDFMAATLSVQIFDVLANKLPHLRTLSVQFIKLQSNNITSSREEQVELFTSLVEARRYSSWKLKLLRLTRIERTCNNAHPQSRTMRTVAQSLPTGVVLDCSYDCFCQKGLFGGEEEE